MIMIFNSRMNFFLIRFVEASISIINRKKDKIFSGDELVAINDQIVVGWSLNNVVNMLKSW